jgi:hypothetical protein
MHLAGVNVKQITIKYQNSIQTFKIDLMALKAEMIEVENKIRATKKTLHQSHTVKTAN